MTPKELYQIRYDFLHKHHRYRMCRYNEFDYTILNNIMYSTRSGRGKNDTWSDAIIMADTETSRKIDDECENHIVAWTISIRAFNLNLCTLWGQSPDEMMLCITKLRECIQGDRMVIFFHNYPYDYMFTRKFLFQYFGHPAKQLNIKSHYPLFMDFDNGIQIRDSLILAQRSLEKWAKDMQVEHLKSTGKWNYLKLRTQHDILTLDELEYIEHDTLAGVECIDKTLTALNKKIWSCPYTATGIPREEVRRRGKANGAKDLFNRIAITYEQYIKLTKVFHGGFTHANRYYIGKTVLGKISCYDFASSYPFVLLSERYPMEKFTSMDNCKLKDIIDSSEETAFMFKLILYKPRLKNKYIPMPALQASKAVKSVNAVIDNGRILKADYVEIYFNEVDAGVIYEQYKFDGDLCTEVEYSNKDYLPRWFTDYIFELFTDKCLLKGGDPVLYALAKAKLNSLYGLCVQKSIKEMIEENYLTGEFKVDDTQDEQELYEKYLSNRGNILLFSWGCWCTSYAFCNLFELGKCVDNKGDKISHWIYSDTDSCYSDSWDIEKVQAYNEKAKQKLCANDYGCVTVKGREFWLGIAEHKEGEDDYTEFRTVGAKRYCGRNVEDGKLHLTVAGVPKKTGALCLDDNIENFKEGFIFEGKKTGKLTHKYYYVDEIYTDEAGNITGDSIDLLPCDYLLSAVDVDDDWSEAFTEEITYQIYDGGRII